LTIKCSWNDDVVAASAFCRLLPALVDQIRTDLMLVPNPAPDQYTVASLLTFGSWWLQSVPRTSAGLQVNAADEPASATVRGAA
jgi:hypothetical protein